MAQVERFRMSLRVPGRGSASIDLNLHHSPFLAVIVQTSGDRAARACIPLGGAIARNQIAGTPFGYASDGQRLTLSSTDDAEHAFEISILF